MSRDRNFSRKARRTSTQQPPPTNVLFSRQAAPLRFSSCISATKISNSSASTDRQFSRTCTGIRKRNKRNVPGLFRKPDKLFVTSGAE